MLLSAGANIHQTVNQGVNCLHLAAKSNSVCITHYLISNKLFDIDCIDQNGCTALHWACLEGSYDIIKYLLAEGANPNA